MQAGDTVANRFDLEHLAGQGGMGLVYRALDRHTGRPVALKVLSGVGGPAEQRFAREAGILATLSHPAIVRYVAHGHTPTGTYLAMEWLEGEDLATRLVRGPSLTWAESLAVARAVAGALGAAHAAGVVHRDIKPSNIFLDGGRTEDARLLDFGVARLETATRPATRTGAVLGTPWYMAPEQAAGSHAVDARADVFSLGCVLYECLTGSPPFDGDAPIAVLAKILLSEAPRLSERFADVSPALDALVARMLDKVPDARPADGACLAAELDRLGAVDGGRRAAQSERPPTLTDSEQRLLSLLVAVPAEHEPERLADTLGHDPTLCHVPPAPAGPDGLATQRTLEAASPSPASRNLARALSPYGASVHVLVDGSLLALVSGDGRPSEGVARIARSALVARELMPGARIAVATGRGVLAARLPVGDVVERALALGSGVRGLPGAIRVDEVTAGLLCDGFELGGDAHGLVLLGERQAPETVRTLLGRPMPCVGRQRELSILEATATECRQESVARAMLVTGEAGVGKSRLRFELSERLRRREEGWEVWLCRQSPLSAHAPFGMIAPALRRAAGIRDGEPVALRSQKLRARVQRHVPPASVARISEFLGELAGIPADGPESPELEAARRDPLLMGDQIRRAFVELCAAEAAAHPLLIAVDDLQWGDAPSLELCDTVLRVHPELPIFVVALGRPEVHAVFPRLWDQRGVQELRLGGLTRRAAEELVRQALGDRADAAGVAAIVERSGGNAFFLEELVRVAAEGRVGALPETVLAMVQARLEALDPEARRVLRAASVYGAAFWHGGVAALLGRAVERTGALERALELLCERELVYRRADCRFPSEREYAFRSLTVREAAYALLTPEDQRLGHRLAGAWLERAGESDPSTLAEHFARGGETARAAVALGRAAAQALEAHDFEAAIARARRGLELGAAGELAAELGLCAAEGARWLGRFAEGVEHALRAAEHATPGTAAWYRAAEELLTAHLRLGRFASAPLWAERLLTEPHAEGAASARLSALCQAARVLFQAGDYRGAGALTTGCERLLASATDLTPRARAEVHRLHGARARHAGDVAGDFEGYRAALEHGEAGDEREACNARVSLGFAYVELGAYPEARATLEQALAAARAMGLDAVATRARQNLALVAAAEGDLGGATALALAVLAETQSHGDRQLEAWTRIYLGRFAAQAGDHAEAASQARRAFALLDPNAPARVGALAVLARAALGLGHLVRAESAARAAMRLLASFEGIEELEALVRLAYVEVMSAVGDDAEAAAALEAARVRLRATAARLCDPHLRRSFLERVPENRALFTRELPCPSCGDCIALRANGA